MRGDGTPLSFLAGRTSPLSAAEDSVTRIVRSVRAHLDMDIAFVTEFIGDHRTFRHVDSRTGKSPIKVGDRAHLDRGYCRKITEGSLPELIANTADVPESLAIPETRVVPIGSHLGVPIRLSDGRIYGTFCCVSFSPNSSLNQRDLSMMRAFADLIAHQVEEDAERATRLEEISERITGVLSSGGPSVVYQPTFGLKDNMLIGAESLSRFQHAGGQTPDVWFSDAAKIGLQSQLELHAIRNAIGGFRPAWRSGMYLGMNCSPQTLIDGGVIGALADAPPDRVVIEITEHDHVANYNELMAALAPLRRLGVKIAVDDVGSGYASMRHVLNIRPDIIKLDISMTRGIDTDTTRRALAGALCEFGRQTDCKVIAEGIETSSEFETLRRLGVDGAQGYYLGRPVPFTDFERQFIRLRQIA